VAIIAMRKRSQLQGEVRSTHKHVHGVAYFSLDEQAIAILQALKFDPFFAEQFATLCNYSVGKTSRGM